MGWFGDDDDEDGDDGGDGLPEAGPGPGRPSGGGGKQDRRDEIRGILDDYSVDSFSTAEEGEFERATSREYKEYKSAEEHQRERNWYEKAVDLLGFYDVTLGGMQEKVDSSVDMLNWEVDTHRIFSAAVVVATATFFLSIAVMFLQIPTAFKVAALLAPGIVLYYFVDFPVLQAQRRVINSSDELILTLLYMVIYMRNSPNIEGGVRFAALNTEGAVSRDLKRILWEAEVGNYTSVQEALMVYARKWRPYNKDFIQSVELLVEATAEGDNDRRENILAEAIDNMLEGTRDQMKEYARELRMPVAATFGIGVLLPVLGMILFPLVASFMGGDNLVYYLVFIYNFALPIVLYIIVYHVLIKRPPNISTQNVEGELLPEKGVYTVTIGDQEIGIPVIIPALIVFVLLGAWPLSYYFRVVTGSVALPPNPEQNVDVVTMLRSLLMTLSMSLSLGLYLYMGNVQRIKKLKQVEAIEDEFPEALFQLGNALGRGSPIETGIRRAIDNMDQLEIAEMFRMIEYNMNELGLTFGQSIFDREYGALRHYPSQLIESVMKAINQSSHKGTRIVSTAMMSISTYLKNIYKTEDEIMDQLSETLATMTFLAFILAPVISGVALGLGTIIIKAFWALQTFADEMNVGDAAGGDELDTGGAGAGGMADGSSGLLEMFNADTAVAPDILQLVIGIYLIQLLFIIGMFYVRLTRGRNPVVRKMFTGKVLIVTPVIYAITTLILLLMFGDMITSALEGAAAAS